MHILLGTRREREGMTCRWHVRAATRLARRRGVPYGSPRRSKVRSAQNPAALLELPDSSSALPCSSSPNRTRSAGLRFGFLFCPQNWLICFAYSPRDSKQSRTGSTAASGIRLRRCFYHFSVSFSALSGAFFNSFIIFPSESRSTGFAIWAVMPASRHF